MLSFKCSREDLALISKIMDRACAPGFAGQPDALVQRHERMDVTMSLNACHSSGHPLRLAELLVATDFNFSHDVLGIARNIDPETGQLLNCFSPRYSA